MRNTGNSSWRLADLGAKHAFLRAGLGWGAMPVGVIEADLANGSLVKIKLEDLTDASMVITNGQGAAITMTGSAINIVGAPVTINAGALVVT